MQFNRPLSLRPADLLGEFDRLLRSGLDRSSSVPREFSLYEADHAWVLQTDLPGYRKKDLAVEVHDGVLTLTASGNDDPFTTGFTRSLRLPDAVRTADISARLEHGVLELTLPKEEVVKPQAHRIDIN